jgi:putative transcriptional regulator
MKYNNSLSGKILIASPSTEPDSLFHQSVIYVVKHDKNGAIGLIVNQPIKNLPDNLHIKNSWDIDGEDLKFNDIKSYMGGPVDLDKGFVLHTNDYQKNIIDKKGSISLSSNIEVLKDISLGNGPLKSLFLFGYCGWDKGQLEEELESNQWLTSHSSVNTIFDEQDKLKWQKAIKEMKIQPAFYSSETGHC